MGNLLTRRVVFSFLLQSNGTYYDKEHELTLTKAETFVEFSSYFTKGSKRLYITNRIENTIYISYTERNSFFCGSSLQNILEFIDNNEKKVKIIFNKNV